MTAYDADEIWEAEESKAHAASDLKERLQKILADLDREAAWEAEVNGGRPDLWPDVDVPVALVREAAARIVALEAELAEARKEREDWAGVANREDECRQMWQARATAAEARAEKLAEAREWLRKLVEDHYDDWMDGQPDDFKIATVTKLALGDLRALRAALAQEGGRSDG
jgi:hypothetical protein